MAMKMIAFKNGIHITVPDDDGRAVVFGSCADEGLLSFTLEGSPEAVLQLILELARVGLQECKDKDMRTAFTMCIIEVLAHGYDPEKKDR